VRGEGSIPLSRDVAVEVLPLLQFLMLKATGAQDEAPTQINVVLNSFEELKAKVPVN
jgi:hypothetical protein